MTQQVKIYFDVGSGQQIPIVLDHSDAVCRYLDRRLKEDDWPFSGGVADEFAAVVNTSTGVGSAQSWATDLPTLQINSYLHPGGASRFGRGLFLIDHTRMPQLLSAAWTVSWQGEGAIPQPGNGNQNAVTLNIQGRSHFRAKLYLQTPIQLDVTTESSGDPRQLWLCPFVDARFAKLHSVTDPETLNVKSSTTRTWTQVATDVGSVGPGTVTNVGTVDTAYLGPDPGYFSVPRSAAYALDHIANSSGRRIAFLPEQETFQVVEVSQAETDLTTYIGNMRQTGFPVTLGEPGGNPAAPDAYEYDFSARIMRDYYANDSWDKRTAQSGSDSGDTGKPHLLSTFYLEYDGSQPESGSDQRWQALTDKLAEDFRSWQQKQFCVSYADCPGSGSLIQSPFTNYTMVRITGTSETPEIFTTHQSYKTQQLPRINICQSTNLYRHNQELARVTLTGSGIQQGASSGQGTITKLDTNYDGSTQQVTVNLVAPAGATIPAGTVLSVYWQSNDGWYAVQGQPGPAGGSGSPWIQFRVNAITGEGVWDCYVLQHRNTDELTTPLTCGDQVTVYDPANIGPDVVAASDITVTRCLPGSGESDFTLGSIGTAYYRTTSTSCQNPEGVNRWEVETVTQSINELTCVLKDGCIKSYSPNPLQTYRGLVNESDINDLICQAPNRDFPAELEDSNEGSNCWEIEFWNPFALNAVENSILFLKRWSQTGPSIAANTTVPHSRGSSDVQWYLDRVREQTYEGWVGRYAKFATFQKIDGVGDFVDGVGGNYNLTYYWDGSSPRVGTGPNDPCRPTLYCSLGESECACIDPEDSPYVICSFDPVAHAYAIIGTQASLLGKPEQKDVILSIAAKADGCGFDITKQFMKTFPCGSLVVPQTVDLNTVNVDVVDTAYLQGTNLCFSKKTIAVCSAEDTTDLCVDICICEDCADSNCVYTYNSNTGYWLATTLCPEGCECSGEAPTNTPAPGEPTTVTYPCRNPTPPPVPCTTCDGCTFAATDCEVNGYEINMPTMSATNASNQTVILDGTSGVINRTGDCTWEITGLVWNNTTTGFSTPASVTVTQGLPGNSTNLSCTPYAFLTLDWTPAQGQGITFPVELNAGVPQCAPTGYGQGGGGGCGVMPTNPGGGGFWQNVTMQTLCCDGTEAANDAAYWEMVEASKTEIVASTNFNQAMLGGHIAEPVATDHAQGIGDAFKKQNGKLFTSCKCTSDTIPVMNRWTSIDQITQERTAKVAKTIYAKQGGDFRKKYPTEDSFAERFHDWIVEYQLHGVVTWQI